MQERVVIICAVLFLVNLSQGLEYNRQQQRYNPSTDFLLHEAGYPNNAVNKDQLNTQSSASPTQQNIDPNNGKRDYIAQFPQLRPPSTTKPSTVGSTSNQNAWKRDHVATSPLSPNPVTPKSSTTGSWNSQSSGKRDYVASDFPILKPNQGSNVTPKPSTSTNLSTQGTKRDYVNPQYPTLKPVQNTNQPTNGKVKDLINFYDGKNGNHSPPQKMPSYSSILSGSTNKNTPGSTPTMSLSTHTTPKPSSNPTKPWSFSNVVTGSHTPSRSPIVTTPRPSSTNLPSRPSSPALPSSINKNKNQANNNVATDTELQTLSEELLRKDVNNAAKYVTINYQQKTTSQSTTDQAPNPLLTISPEVWNIPTIQTFVPLLDNYERDTQVNEHVTPQERNEENAFMDAIMATSVMRHLMNFLKDKGYVTPDPRQQRDFVKQLWFGLYSRSRGKISSSGFEHVFVSELKNGGISGLHNWIYFSKEEQANRVNYLGYLKHVQLGEKGAVVKLHFNQQGVDKPVGSMFIGTSPEMEIALYTLCFVTRVDNECKLKLANNDIEVIAHNMRYRSKDHIGSAYPQIPSNFNY